MNAINQLKNGRASSLDKATITLSKAASEFNAHSLVVIYNSSLLKGAFLTLEISESQPNVQVRPKNRSEQSQIHLCNLNAFQGC